MRVASSAIVFLCRGGVRVLFSKVVQRAVLNQRLRPASAGWTAGSAGWSQRAVLSASAAKLIVIRELQSKNIAVVFTNLHRRSPGPIQPAFCPSPSLAPMGLGFT